MDDKTTAALKVELPQVFALVVAYALKLCATKPWFRGSRETIRDAAREFALEAVARTLRGSRAWVPGEKTLEMHLRGVVESLASNRATAAEMRTSIFSSDPVKEMETSADVGVDRPQTPLDYYLSDEACEGIESDAYELACEDPLLCKFVQAVVDGHHDVSEIERVTGLTPKEIYAAKKKLKARRERASRRIES